MRISDWSSDVCSSDLLARQAAFALAAFRRVERDHMFARLHTGDARPHFAHDACAFMTEDAGEDAFAVKAIQRVGVGVADAGRHDLDQHLARLRAFKIDLDNLKRFLRFKCYRRARSEEHTSELQSLMR